MSGEESYDRRIGNERRFFAKNVDVHALPQAHHYWTNRYLRPEVERVFGYAGPVEIYAQEAARTFALTPSRRLVSLGSGRGEIELMVLERLAELGHDDVLLECLEITPRLCEAGAKLAAEKGLASRVTFTETDVNRWEPEPGGYAVVIANEFLHHIVELERVFDAFSRALAPQGRILTRDVMGRNGHVCWPEVRQVVDSLWNVLPEEYLFNNRDGTQCAEYPDIDCSTEGFEGIRAQDVLPLLCERFHFERFVAFGGLIERFAGRAFGHNFRVDERESDRTLIDMIYLMNRMLVDQGVIKPTQLVATLTLEDVEPVVGFGWKPAWCIRPTG